MKKILLSILKATPLSIASFLILQWHGWRVWILCILVVTTFCILGGELWASVEALKRKQRESDENN